MLHGWCNTNIIANLTISIDEEVLKLARIKALKQGTSVNALLIDYLESYSGSRQIQEDSIKDLLALSHNAQSRSKGKKWSRDELHSH